MTGPAASTALLTDRYELTMLEAALRDGTAHRRCVFELFGRRLAGGRRFGVVAGTGRLLELIRDFRFGDDELRFLRDERVVDAATLAYLEGYRFTGSIIGYREGELYFPGSPILMVEGTFAEAVILETLALSVLNHDSAIATAAARMSVAAGDRPLVEMGSRRAGERSAVAAARAAYIAGFGSTSNLEAGRAWGIPTHGHRRARVDPAPRHRGGRLPRADRRPRRRHDAARRHLRHRRRRRDGRARRRHAARRCAHRLRRPADVVAARCARSSTSSAPPARRSP